MKQYRVWIKTLIIGILVLCLMSSALFVIGKKELRTHPFKEAYATDPCTVVLPDTVIDQAFINHGDHIMGVKLRFATYGLTMTNGQVDIELWSDKLLGSSTLYAQDIPDGTDVYFSFGDDIKVKRRQTYHLKVYSTLTDDTGNRPALWCIEPVKDCILINNNILVNNTLYMDVDSSKNAQFYFRFFLSAAFMIGMFCYIIHKGYKNDKDGTVTPLTEMIHIFDEYRFLLSKLVGRDFAVKYRRSYLGFLWVIINPLLTMIVMSAVFSYIFRLQIQNYAVYLILGNIVFGCFSEATQTAAVSIVSSGQLIKKVYMPKYIFPLSKIIFSFFNFLLTLIPAVMVIIYFKIPFTINYLLLPYVLIGLFLFSLGIGMFLSTMHVYMRDTQYLYGILITLWTYLTPIFYSEESLAPALQKFMQLNPMFLYIRCFRKIMLYGITPTVFELTICIVLGAVSTAIGMKYFYKKQKNFILYI